MNCLNCGELWHDCICLPWCYEHNTYRPCAACRAIEKEKLENAKMLEPFMVKWYINILHLFTGQL